MNGLIQRLDFGGVDSHIPHLSPFPNREGMIRMLDGARDVRFAV